MSFIVEEINVFNTTEITLVSHFILPDTKEIYSYRELQLLSPNCANTTIL